MGLMAGALATAAGACAANRGAPHDDVVDARGGAPAVSFVAAFDLPAGDPRARELSAIAWDEASRTLFAVSDALPRIVSLTPNATFDAWTFGTPISMTITDQWDGEGLALTQSAFFVANERGPHIYEVDRTGLLRGEVPVLPSFGSCVPNKCIESLTLSPDGLSLFYANESALSVDGPQPTASTGTTVRLVRHDRQSGEDVVWAYRTEPIFSAAGGGDMGVSDMVALSQTELLVLERSYVPSHGVSARIFRVTLDAADAEGAKPFSACTSLKKTLLVDIAALYLRSDRASWRMLQPNYEGMSLGPALPSGERLLFLVSDDNANPELPARVLTLRVTLR